MTKVLVGDCVEQMRTMAEASVDSIVTDPPYGLEFMGKEWDRLGGDGFRRQENPADVGRTDVFGRTTARSPEYRAGLAMQTWHEEWAREALRVLKPGGHLLAFGGTRTYHRLACGLEDAGFEIRDCIFAWMYGSGFPKSLDVSKAIDKAAGVERDIIGPDPEAGRRNKGTPRFNGTDYSGGEEWQGAEEVPLTAPATPEAEKWQGWGTALKPAHEPIVVARKPLAGTVASTVLAHGTGALNIDVCRIGTDSIEQHGRKARDGGGWGDHWHNDLAAGKTWQGRWPANVVLVHADGCERVGSRAVDSDGHFPATRPASATDGGPTGHVGQADLAERQTRGEQVEVWQCAPGCPVATLDEQSGISRSAGGRINNVPGLNDNVYGGGWQEAIPGDPGFGDVGGASRFFYTAKASRAERNAGLEAFEKKPLLWSSGEQNPGTFQAEGKAARNNHPTVKPIALMRWLVRLVTKPGGLVLDPFAGSGTTGIACALEGMAFVGIEQDADYAKIAEARISFWTEHGENGLRICAERDKAAAKRAEIADLGQLDLFA